MSSAALVPQDLIAPRGLSLVRSGIYKVRVAWSVRLAHLRAELGAAFALRRAQAAELVDRVRVALDPAISRRVAAYRVSEAHGFGLARAAAPLDAEVGSWVQPVELAASFLDTEHRRVLARHWLSQGQGAHAAIAAYTQLAGELLALGAHPELLMHVHAAALERVKIGHRARHMPSQLSGGQQQRVAIARAVVARPKLILADEPTGNLDTVNGEEVMQMLTQLNDEGTTIVMVTHSHSHAQYAHRVVNLLDGAIVTESIRQVL